jgi:uncharacterized RDD family membrane protein YckC
MSYAGFWRRVAATLIDWLVLAAAGFAIGFIVGVVAAIAGRDSLGAWESLLNVVLVVASYLYFAVMESSELQGTVGKVAIGIKVTDLQGNRISFGRALGRTVAKILSSLILGIGYIMAAFTKRKQALHDMIAGTLVVKRDPAASPGAIG